MGRNVLIIGNGGREDALAWRIRQLANQDVFAMPGNPGTRRHAVNIAKSPYDPREVLDAARRHDVELVVIGPEDVLETDLASILRSHGFSVVGPSRAAARIETSKKEARSILKKAGVPTPRSRSFSDISEAHDYLARCTLPIVIKASGLAAGKGVQICTTREEATRAIRDFMSGYSFGDAAKTIVMQEWVQGDEVSFHALAAGTDFLSFPPAVDHPEEGDGGTGRITGGMGAVLPTPYVSPNRHTRVNHEVVGRILHHLEEQGTPFFGCLYPGVIMTPRHFHTIEVNARFGDPEAEAYMQIVGPEFLNALYACAHDELAHCNLSWNVDAVACITVAAAGYPGSYTKGDVIEGIRDAERLPGVTVFHGGTTDVNGVIETAGGRVLFVCAHAPSLKEAITTAYRGVEAISFRGKTYRTDIGREALRALHA